MIRQTRVVPAHAVTTRVWRITNYKDFEEGEAHGVLLSSLGDVSSGLATTRVEVGESVVYSSLLAPDGSIYLGTGDQGALYVYQKGKVRRLAKLDVVLISSLANSLPVGPVAA